MTIRPNSRTHKRNNSPTKTIVATSLFLARAKIKTGEGDRTTTNNSPTNSQHSQTTPSRRQTTAIPQSMGANIGQPMGQLSYRRRVQDSISHQPTDSLPETISVSDAASGGTSHRTRGNIFISQESHRRRFRSWFHKSNIHNSQENWRHSTSLESKTIKLLRQRTTFQDGDPEDNMLNASQERSHDEHRSIRRFPARLNSPSLSPLPSVSMERTAIPVPHTSLRSVIVASRIHQDTETTSQMGEETGDQNVSISGRSYNIGKNKGTIDTLHQSSNEQTERARIPSQRVKIISDTITNSKSSRLYNQLKGYDNNSSPAKDSRHQKGSSKASPQRHRKFKGTFFIRRESNGHLNRNIPSTTNDTQSSSTQELSTSSSQLERQSESHRTSQGEPEMVDGGVEDMEWSVVDTTTSTNGHLHGCLGQGLGNSDQSQNMEWDMVIDRVSPTHQLERIENSTLGNQATTVSRENVERHMRQHDYNSTYQQIRRNKIPSTNDSGRRIMETLSSNRHTNKNNIRSLSIQSSGCSIATTSEPTGMEDQSTIFPSSGQNLGTSQGGLIRVSREHSPSKVHVLEISSISSSSRCTSTLMDNTGQLIHMPTVEPNSSSTGEDSIEQIDSDPDNTMVVERDMVPRSKTNVTTASTSNTTGRSIASNRKRRRDPQQESSLDLNSMAHKRIRHDVEDGLLPAAVELLNKPTISKHTRSAYQVAQTMFLDWAKDEGVDIQTANAIHVVNFLCQARIIHGWSRSTTLNKKSAILKLYDDPHVITGNTYFKRFIKALGESEIFYMEKLSTLDISPIINQFNATENSDLDMLSLSRKLCWLLGVCAFLRPDDIGGIDITTCKVETDGLHLSIFLPKEKRNGQRIVKRTLVKRHSDNKRLCPVEAYLEYTHRIRDSTLTIKHHMNESIEITPLLRFIKDPNKALRVNTIGVYMSTISKMIPGLPVDKPPPKARAIGSTLAAMSGTATQDIMVQGNWSSTAIFEKHYRLSNRTSSNITSVVLGSL